VLGTAHDHAHHDLIALAEDILYRGVRVRQGGHHPGKQPGDVRAALDRTDGAAVPLHTRGQVAGGVVAVVLVDDVPRNARTSRSLAATVAAPPGLCDAVAGRAAVPAVAVRRSP
jgi:hypothetical protein